MAIHAIECLRDGRLNRIVAYKGGKVLDLDIEEALTATKTITREELDRAMILSL